MVMVLLIWKDESKSPVFTVNFPKDFFAYTKNCLSTCILRVGDGQGGLACCNSRGRKESDTTEQLNWTDFIQKSFFKKDFKKELQLVNFIPVRLLCLWDSPGQNTGVGCCALLQGIFPTQGSKPSVLCFLNWKVGSLPLVPPGKPLTSCLPHFKDSCHCISPTQIVHWKLETLHLITSVKPLLPYRLTLQLPEIRTWTCRGAIFRHRCKGNEAWRWGRVGQSWLLGWNP